MAIDSAVKRKSVAGVARPWRPGVVVPDGTIDSADRQAIGWSYAGISAASVGLTTLTIAGAERDSLTLAGACAATVTVEGA